MKVSTLIPMLCFQNASLAIEFYKKAFGAEEINRITDSGKVIHAELKLGQTKRMFADELPEIDVKSPVTVGACPIILLLETDDADALFLKAVEAGSKIDRELQTMEELGIRNGKIIDPFGYKWMISSAI